MNERIQELADQARKYARDYVAECKHYGHYMEHNEYELRFEEKFAELIAKECAQLAMTQHHSTSPDDYGEIDQYDKGCDDTASIISGLIRRTFGVE